MSDTFHPEEQPPSDGEFVPPPVPPKQRTTERFSMIEGAASGLRMVSWLAVGLFVLFWCSGITTIQPGEVGLLLRCGKLVGATPSEQIRQPGLLLALPYPIDEVIRVPVKQEREISVAALRSRRIDLDGVKTGVGLNGYALSGDQNILQADLTLKYRIRDPIAYRLGNDDPERILRDIATGAAAETIAAWNVDDALRLQRESDVGPQKLAFVVRDSAQQLADTTRLGVEITAVEFREIQPPEAVADAFQSVQSERIAIETKKRESEGFAARTVPAAEAESNSMIQEANRLATDLRTRAEEEVELFDRLHDEYRRNPELVWNRLHLETIEGLMRDGSQFRFVDPGTRLILTPRGHRHTQETASPPDKTTPAAGGEL
ncbi:protease modulator HflK [Stratiformator vulcanicus]|uniref:Modulator of FtsH protease HflK n=1 Tax=Stratiformator vulcanicus TaxID=2527980 RepID=A0A517QYC0_9PLAN|nr:protease modulator HflK [Stratiformator vulcanicus]QDT36659.1 Modulator of FtsH protease HflK [Stratiformator vulcanicus]